MENKPRLSVLMPAYNASQTIGIALISALLTLPRDAELIIWLDGPSTKSRLLDFLSKDKRIRLVGGPTRVGLVRALNGLLREARGDIVARLDADDLALPFRYKKPMRLISRNEADVVFANAILVNTSAASFLPQPPIGFNPAQSRLGLMASNPFVHGTLVARKSVIENLGGYRESTAEDYDLWLRMAVQGIRIRRLVRHTLIYRVHNNQVTSDPSFSSRLELDELIRSGKRDLALWLKENFDNEIDLKAPELWCQQILLKSKWQLRIWRSIRLAFWKRQS